MPNIATLANASSHHFVEGVVALKPDPFILILWQTFGRIVGGAVRNTFDVLEDIAEYIGDNYENPRYNGTWQC